MQPTSGSYVSFLGPSSTETVACGAASRWGHEEPWATAHNSRRQGKALGDAADWKGHLATQSGSCRWKSRSPIPWDQISVYVAQKKKQMEDEAAEKARKSLPSVTVPHL